LGWDLAGAARAGTAAPSHPEPADLAGLPFKEARDAWTERFESVYVRAVLEKSGGNVSRAADLAGLNRRSLHRIIARLGIRDEDADVDD
jgi:DNA-binding NtrC family response regulator